MAERGSPTLRQGARPYTPPSRAEIVSPVNEGVMGRAPPSYRPRSPAAARIILRRPRDATQLALPGRKDSRGASTHTTIVFSEAPTKSSALETSHLARLSLLESQWRRLLTLGVLVPVVGQDHLEYPSAEHAYQAAKLGFLRGGSFKSIAERRRTLLDIRTSWKVARDIGAWELDPLLEAAAWDLARGDILRALMYQRYAKDETLRSVLRETEDLCLRYALPPEQQMGHDSSWWGCRLNAGEKWEGDNALGAVWMELRGGSAPAPAPASAPAPRGDSDSAPAFAPRGVSAREPAWLVAGVPRPLVRAPRQINAVFIGLRRGTDILVCRPGAALPYPGRDGIRDRGWHLPGGCVDPGESGTFADTGRREFEEEIGVPPPRLAKLVKDVVWQDRRNPANGIRFCLLSLPAGSLWDAPKSSEEMEEIRWIPQRTLARGGEKVRAVAGLLARTFIVPKRK